MGDCTDVVNKRRTRDSELDWFRWVGVTMIIAMHVLQDVSVYLPENLQSWVNERREAFSFLLGVEGAIIPIMFLISAETSVVTTRSPNRGQDSCPQQGVPTGEATDNDTKDSKRGASGKKRGGAPVEIADQFNQEVPVGAPYSDPHSYARPAHGGEVQWYVGVIILPKVKRLLIPFVVSYLTLAKIDHFVPRGDWKEGEGLNMETWWKTVMENWNMGHTWFILFLWVVFMVNGFHIVGAHRAQVLVSSVASIPVLFWFLFSALTTEGISTKVALARGSMGGIAFLGPYVCLTSIENSRVHLENAGYGGWALSERNKHCVVAAVIFLSNYVLTASTYESTASNSPILWNPIVKFVDCNHFFLLGVHLRRVMHPCQQWESPRPKPFPVWARGAALMCTMGALWAVPDHANLPVRPIHTTMSRWAWLLACRGISRALFEGCDNGRTATVENPVVPDMSSLGPGVIWQCWQTYQPLLQDFLHHAPMYVYLLHPPISAVLVRYVYSGAGTPWSIAAVVAAVTSAAILCSLLGYCVISYALVPACKHAYTRGAALCHRRFAPRDLTRKEPDYEDTLEYS